MADGSWCISTPAPSPLTEISEVCVLHRFLGVPRGIKFHSPTAVAESTTHPFLAAFSLLSYFPICYGCFLESLPK